MKKLMKNVTTKTIIVSMAFFFGSNLCLQSALASGEVAEKEGRAISHPTRPIIQRSHEPSSVDNNFFIRSTLNRLLPLDTASRTSNTIESVELESMHGEKIIYIQTKAEQLSEKMIKAEFTVMALNDINFVKQALTTIKHQAVPDSYSQCVFDSLDRENYLRELKGVAQYLVDTYPNDVDAYIAKLDFLIPIVREIHQHPDVVNFNSDKLSSSSALMILTQANAEELERTVNDEQYIPLLATIGLPTKRADGKIEDISIMQVDTVMEYINTADSLCAKTHPTPALDRLLTDLQNPTP